MTKDLFLAILSMDAYNRGYNPGITGLSDEIGTQIGNAAILNRTSSLPNSPEVAAGFYAVAYEWNGETIISYRGTELLNRVSSRQPSHFCFGKSGQNQGRPVQQHRMGRTRAMEEQANSRGSNKARGKIRASVPWAGRQASIGEEERAGH